MTDYKNIKNKLEKIRNSNLIQKGDKILIAFSGGPDSVFLYHVLKYIQKDFELKISLLYVNHNLRTDVQEDMDFTKEFSERNRVPFYIESVNVNDYVIKNKKSTELSARELRYMKLNEVLNSIGYDKIATGHNLDDNVETIIFRLLRGTSVKGLKGIPEKRENIIRPILEFEKKEILSFLNKNNENYITDYTNNENDYTRNYIRNELFPMFSKINPSFRKKVSELITEIKHTENRDIQQDKSKKNLILLLEENEISLSRQKIDQIYHNFFKKNGELKSEGSKEFSLGKGKVLRKIYNKLEIVKKNEYEVNNKKINRTELKKNQSIEWYTYIVSYFENIENFKKNYTNSLKEYENVTFLKFKSEVAIQNAKLIIRKKENGDKIYISKVGSQKVKKIFIDKKISKWERERIPIIELEKKYKKMILAIGNIKNCEILEKINRTELEKIQKNESILVIRRKDER